MERGLSRSLGAGLATVRGERGLLEAGDVARPQSTTAFRWHLLEVAGHSIFENLRVRRRNDLRTRLKQGVDLHTGINEWLRLRECKCPEAHRDHQIDLEVYKILHIGVIFDGKFLRVWKALGVMRSFGLVFESISRCESWFLLRY